MSEIKEPKKSKLKAVLPEKIEKRLKLFLYGSAGVGKTMAAIQFPNAYVIDSERGCENYTDTLAKHNSVLFQSNDVDEIRAELETLLIEDHGFKTLIIDPITIIYSALQDTWAKRMPATDMRYWGKIKADWKSMQRLIHKLDMNVIVTAHQKIVYGDNFQKLGVSFDSMKADDHFFDNVFRMEKRGIERWVIAEKQRVDIGKPRFPDEFQWSYDNFLKYYGKGIIERKSTAIKLASPEHIEKIKKLLDVVKIPDDTTEKWFNKADIEKWEEMTEDQILKCIDFVEKKIGGK